MIIFGVRAFAQLIATLNVVCGRCGNPAAQRVVKRTRWFTLFFIPIFPIGVTRVMTCTYCGQASRLSKEQAEQMIAAASGATHSTLPPQNAAPQQLHPAPPEHPQH